MGYDRDHLSKLLDFIRVLYNDPTNGEFAEGLRGIVSGTGTQAGSSTKIDKIEKYLALDYGLDEAENPDYAFIKDVKVRNTLNADWREMLRCRYGLRGHKENFGEFARCAHLQVEMLLDIYYTDKYGEPDKILEHLQANAAKEKEKNDKVADIKSLNTWSKIYCLQFETGRPFWEFTCLRNLNALRNGESHRSQSKEEITKTELTFSNIEESLSNLTRIVREAMTY